MTRELYYIPYFEDYLIDISGNIYRIGEDAITSLEPAIYNTGEGSGIVLEREGKTYWRAISRLMVETFITAFIPQEADIEFRDGNVLNNSLSNLMLTSEDTVYILPPEPLCLYAGQLLTK